VISRRSNLVYHSNQCADHAAGYVELDKMCEAVTIMQKRYGVEPVSDGEDIVDDTHEIAEIL
jgi:hypothetical protein